MASSTISGMRQFYSGKNIFITGSTGFIGNVLLEKMLSAFPDIGSVYVLVREKKNVACNDRLKQLCNKPIFTKYGRVDVKNLSKIVGIEGQLGDHGLQISEKDRKKLIEQVHVVFHVASTIRFNEPLDVAMKSIFIGTKTMLSLANEMHHLSSFVYVSTAYSNAQQQTSDEVVYDMKIDGDSVLALYENNSKEHVSELVQKNYFDGRPNTYTFAKALTENYIRNHCRHLPVAITRPSGVAAAISEPVPGYCDSPSALGFSLIYQGLGLFQYYPIREEAFADVVPVDTVANSLLIVAREVGLKPIPATAVYNISSFSYWPQTIKQMADCKLKALIRSPPATAVRPFSHRTNQISQFEQQLVKYFSELRFAIIADTIAKICGNKSRMLKLTRWIQSTREEQTIFFQNTWFFPRKNMDAAVSRLSDEDRKLFPALPIVEDNEEYWHNYWMSIREFILGEKADNIDAAKRHQKRLRLQSQIVSLTIAGTCIIMGALHIF